jgi:hypothetical protein
MIGLFLTLRFIGNQWLKKCVSNSFEVISSVT